MWNKRSEQHKKARQNKKRQKTKKIKIKFRAPRIRVSLLICQIKLKRPIKNGELANKRTAGVRGQGDGPIVNGRLVSCKVPFLRSPVEAPAAAQIRTVQLRWPRQRTKPTRNRFFSTLFPRFKRHENDFIGPTSAPSTNQKDPLITKQTLE